jgi:hypothetical protein
MGSMVLATPEAYILDPIHRHLRGIDVLAIARMISIGLS